MTDKNYKAFLYAFGSDERKLIFHQIKIIIHFNLKTFIKSTFKSVLRKMNYQAIFIKIREIHFFHFLRFEFLFFYIVVTEAIT